MTNRLLMRLVSICPRTGCVITVSTPTSCKQVRDHYNTVLALTGQNKAPEKKPKTIK